MKFTHPEKGDLNENKPFMFWASTDGDRIYISGFWGDSDQHESLIIHSEMQSQATSFLKAEIQTKRSLRQREDAIEMSQTMHDLLA